MNAKPSNPGKQTEPGPLALALLFLAATFFAAAVLTGAARAQTWRFTPNDDGSYFLGFLYTPPGTPGFALTCGERSPRGVSPMVTGNVEPDVTRPDAVLMTFGDREIGPFDGYADTRSDVMVVVGDQGYALPQIQWNELNHRWETQLQAVNAMFDRIGAAASFRLYSRFGDITVPADGFAQGYASFLGYCRSMFASVGRPWRTGAARAGSAAGTAPMGGSAGGIMRQAAEAVVRKECNGAATWSPGAFLTGDIDGDGVEDVVLDWSEVSCTIGNPRPYCGAAVCSAHWFLSSVPLRRGEPDGMLAHGVRLQPLTNGNVGIVVGGPSNGCMQVAGTPHCETLYWWNGAMLAPMNLWER